MFHVLTALAALVLAVLTACFAYAKDLFGGCLMAGLTSLFLTVAFFTRKE